MYLRCNNISLNVFFYYFCDRNADHTVYIGQQYYTQIIYGGIINMIKYKFIIYDVKIYDIIIYNSYTISVINNNITITL